MFLVVYGDILSFNDLLNIIKASSAGTILSAALALLVLGVISIPRSIFLLITY